MTPAEITDEIIDECWEVLGTDYHFNVEKARTLFRKAIADAKAIGPVRPRKTFDDDEA